MLRCSGPRDDPFAAGTKTLRPRCFVFRPAHAPVLFAQRVTPKKKSLPRRFNQSTQTRGPSTALWPTLLNVPLQRQCLCRAQESCFCCPTQGWGDGGTWPLGTAVHVLVWGRGLHQPEKPASLTPHTHARTHTRMHVHRDARAHTHTPAGHDLQYNTKRWVCTRTHTHTHTQPFVCAANQMRVTPGARGIPTKNLTCSTLECSCLMARFVTATVSRCKQELKRQLLLEHRDTARTGGMAGVRGFQCGAHNRCLPAWGDCI